MNLDAAKCYEALRSRDRRFDGRFFTGVRTTGIYCRPICPAPSPKAAHVEFYPCAAAAEEAGFRPCRRCRPEAAPGSPAWLGTSATVIRGMKLIAGGALNEISVGQLALRLGVGDRHLRRLFQKHLGASPLAIARTRRTHFARRLIDDCVLPMTDIAYAAGFSSIRQFNATVKKTFGRTPTELRRLGAGARKKQIPAGNSEGLTFRLPFREPFDWKHLLGFLAMRATPGVELVDDTAYHRTVLIDGKPGLIHVRPLKTGGALLLAVDGPVSRHLPALVERVRSLLDLAADPAHIADHLESDSLLARSLELRPGLRLPGAYDGFEIAVRAIVGQQVSVKGATTIMGRLAETYGKPAGEEEPGGALTRLFPTPEALADGDPAAAGMPRARGEAIRNLARMAANGDIKLDGCMSPEQVRDRLLGIRGIGDWTADYIAMRALHEPDAFPIGDLGVRHAFEAAGLDGSPGRIRKRADQWRPWRAYAVMHLWASLSDGDKCE